MMVFVFLWRKHVQFVQNNACRNARNLVDRSVQPPQEGQALVFLHVLREEAALGYGW
jgi:hypothetical protein